MNQDPDDTTRIMACHTWQNLWNGPSAALEICWGFLYVTRLKVKPSARGPKFCLVKMCWALLTYSEIGTHQLEFYLCLQQEVWRSKCFFSRMPVFGEQAHTHRSLLFWNGDILSRHPATMIIFHVLWHYRSVDNFVQFAWVYRMIYHRNCRTRVTRLHSKNWWATYRLRKDVLIFLDPPYICKISAQIGRFFLVNVWKTNSCTRSQKEIQVQAFSRQYQSLPEDLNGFGIRGSPSPMPHSSSAPFHQF